MIRKHKYVYVSAPYSKDPNRCTKRALELAKELVRSGYSPFVPHLCHFWDFIHPMTYSEWMEYLTSWISRCDCLVYIPGESNGVLEEIDVAKSLDIPVYRDDVFWVVEFSRNFDPDPMRE